MTNPEVEKFEDRDEFAGAYVPVYPATAKMSSTKIGKAVKTVLDVLGPLPDPLAGVDPDRLRAAVARRGLPAAAPPGRPRRRRDGSRAAQVGRGPGPPGGAGPAPARRRARARGAPGAPARRPAHRLRRLAPVHPDRGPAQGGRGASRRTSPGPHPMQRLLQGEVGSGKTVVALRAMLTVVDSGGQAALLAPTEVLATQHLRSLRALLGDLAEAGTLGRGRVGDERRAADRLAERGRPAQGAARGGRRQRRHRRRHPRAAVRGRRSSPTSGWSSSTSSTGSVSSSATRCASGRRAAARTRRTCWS